MSDHPETTDKTTPTPTEKWESEQENMVTLALGLANEWRERFPDRAAEGEDGIAVDAENFWQLLNQGVDADEIIDTLDWLPTSFRTQEYWSDALRSSFDFRVRYGCKKGVREQCETYRLRSFETGTESRRESWETACLAAHMGNAPLARLEARLAAISRGEILPDPADAAEEEAWLAADQAIEDGDAAELDPMQDAFAGEREDAEFEDGMHDAFIELPLAPRPAAEVALWKVLAGDEIPLDVWENLARENPKVSDTEMARYQWGVFLGGTRWKFFKAEKDAAEFVFDNSPATAEHAIKVRKLVGA